MRVANRPVSNKLVRTKQRFVPGRQILSRKNFGEMASHSSSSTSNSANNSSRSRSSACSAFTQRLLIGLLVCTLVLDLSCLTEARPQDDPTSVAEAIRLLQELETKHAQHARPRFGKRGYPQPAGYGQEEQERNYYRMIGRIQRFQDEQNAVLN